MSSSYDIQHTIYYDATVQLLVCRNADTREVEFTREGNPIDDHTDLNAIVRDFFEGYQVISYDVQHYTIQVVTRHTRINLEI